tara:strand:- start:1640 stop:2476 length:837 start_codon:yes stop_codon:yes gene_type:complete
MINQLKTAGFLALLTVIFLVIGSYLAGPTGLTVALIFAVVFNLLAYFFSHKLVLAMYKAKEADRHKYAELHEMVKDIAERASIPKPKVYIMESDAKNAFATGPSPKKGVVAVTTGIMSLLTKDELRGVIAHEISHIKNRDILIGTIAAMIAGAISYVAMAARWAAIFGGTNEDGPGLVELIALSIITPLIAIIIQLAISRSREYLADETGAKLIKNPNALADALQKLHSSSKSTPLNASPATAHMFIVNPLSGSALLNLLSTHPPMNKRIGRLRAMRV